jgi:hypothetical protein
VLFADISAGAEISTPSFSASQDIPTDYPMVSSLQTDYGRPVVETRDNISGHGRSFSGKHFDIAANSDLRD